MEANALSAYFGRIDDGSRAGALMKAKATVLAEQINLWCSDTVTASVDVIEDYPGRPYVIYTGYHVHIRSVDSLAPPSMEQVEIVNRTLQSNNVDNCLSFWNGNWRVERTSEISKSRDAVVPGIDKTPIGSPSPPQGRPSRIAAAVRRCLSAS